MDDETSLSRWVQQGPVAKKGLSPRRDFCVYGFEGNSHQRFVTALHEIAKRERNVLTFPGVVAHVQDGNTTFFMDDQTLDSHNAWGSSLFANRHARVGMPARAVDVARLLGMFRRALPPSAFIIVKMDIEVWLALRAPV